MKKVKNKLQVRHYPQVPCPCQPFCVDVTDEVEAKKILDTLALQHLYLYQNNFIPDYANIITVVMWDDAIDEETGKPYGWVDYFNDDECMDWDEFETTYLNI